MSPVSPLGFAYYGSYLAKQGNINEGYHYVKLALSLLDKVGSRENAGVVIFVCTQVKIYVEPLQAALEYYHEGYAAAMASGDSSQATSVDIHGPGSAIQFSLSKLIGTGEEPKYSSEGLDILASNSSALRSYHYQTAYKTSRSILPPRDYLGNIVLAQAVHAFHTGLISFWVARKSKEQRWYQRGNQSKLALRSGRSRPSGHLRINGTCWKQRSHFATTTLKQLYVLREGDNISETSQEALAHELAAYSIWSWEKRANLEHFMLAHEKYLEWGALGKCDSLLKFVEFMKKLWHEGAMS
ncbi:hypothetical protein QTG54_004899 [Skeletonema marinoi]|uniref:Uncharacterized protein n=1 Tax=Skeletonema marinoi TaxID=267567 RepID=A0AAD8YDA1_9STRA|nr:hypothetical protein QTG54_004899 [Skeletonema marinoi]